MFIVIGGIAQHVSDIAGEALLVLPETRKATALEAAQCINRLVFNGDAKMHKANDEFKNEFGA